MTLTLHDHNALTTLSLSPVAFASYRYDSHHALFYPLLHSDGMTTSLSSVSYAYNTSATAYWLTRDLIGEEAFLLTYTRSMPLHDQRRFRQAALRPLYLFVGNDPVNVIDPYGLLEEEDCHNLYEQNDCKACCKQVHQDVTPYSEKVRRIKACYCGCPTYT